MDAGEVLGQRLQRRHANGSPWMKDQILHELLAAASLLLPLFLLGLLPSSYSIGSLSYHLP